MNQILDTRIGLIGESSIIGIRNYSFLSFSSSRSLPLLSQPGKHKLQSITDPEDRSYLF